MAGIDRGSMIERLQLLGAESDETALKAARELDRMVREADASWDELLGGAGAETVPAPAEAAPPSGKAAPAGDDARIVDRLLARKDISDTLRNDLKEFRQQIASGTFDRMDADYVRALAKRLNA